LRKNNLDAIIGTALMCQYLDLLDRYQSCTVGYNTISNQLATQIDTTNIQYIVANFAEIGKY